jgi:mannose/fructose/N-acetylgalactosamine-specific phosphotransferase system component IID
VVYFGSVLFIILRNVIVVQFTLSKKAFGDPEIHITTCDVGDVMQEQEISKLMEAIGVAAMANLIQKMFM